MLSPLVPLVALLLSAPALWAAYTGALPVEAALERLLAAVAVAALGWAAFRALVAGYRRPPTGAPARPAPPHRRDTDPSPPSPPS